jgi:pimeloyl-ACP methyl ester carboxylesterase
MGGYLAFALWRLAPERIRALALCNTRATADAAGARDDRLAMADQVEREQSVESIVEPMVVRMLSPHAQAEAHIVDPVRGRIRRCTPAGIAFAQRAMAARPDSTELLASISVPSLVIAASQDAIIPTHEVLAMADGIPGARYAELDCGHLSNLERPRAVNQQLAEFLVPARMAS